LPGWAFATGSGRGESRFTGIAAVHRR
jgi:hypothetical protein